ncbi:restriction endonuclease [Methylocystis suflitae]|uniref:restriction endonuclease n=1 Tax=Methylocystis suflitae TaxID=2951405 RepID=UPI002109FA32|nr:restriction endonuclease [Methylocystis suflitae]MCQ4189943.1 restriction endonuclease [Methylocystis suflitae]
MAAFDKFLMLLGGGFVLTLSLTMLRFDYTRHIGFLLILLLVFAIVFVWRRENRRQKALEAAKAKIIRIVGEHLETFARRRMVLLRVDHYGVKDVKRWNKEVQHFIDKVIRPQLTLEETWALGAGLRFNPIFQELIEDRVMLRAREIERETAISGDLTPEQFELWCSNTLASNGWKTSTTKASGDQGADVLAEKCDLRVVLQCKLYGTPVGNKAVQEAFAAQRHYVARLAAVVTNAEYTKSARDLANSTGVLLLHHSDLKRFDDIVEKHCAEFRTSQKANA